MSRISQDKIDKIKENVLQQLFEETPKSLFTFEIAESQARDKEFILRILGELEKKRLVRQTQTDFTRKRKWTLTDDAYNAYKGLVEP